MQSGADEDKTYRSLTADDVGEAAQTIRDADPTWAPGRTIALGEGLAWQPELVHDDPKAVLHVHLADRLRPHVVERMRAASGRGYRIHLALDLSALYDEDLLREISTLDPIIHVVGNGPEKQQASLLATLADQGIRVTDATRVELARVGWQSCQSTGTSNEKGHRLEALVAFLLSQIEDFRVVERNLRTETEELDVVVQQGRTEGGRCWMLGVPFILVESKNWASKVTQKELSTFRVKMQGKRGTVRLGLLFAANGHTGDAYDQELRFASDDLTISLIGPDEITAWVEALDDDEFLDSLIRRSMLR